MKFNHEGLPIGVRCHNYNYGTPGWQEEGIRKRIRQGKGGSEAIKPGAEVEGHAHIPRGQSPEKVQAIVATKKDKEYIVKVTYITGFPGAQNDKNKIRQHDPNFIGVDFQGVVVREITSEK